jgi:peroxiredoxin 2/4
MIRKSIYIACVLVLGAIQSWSQDKTQTSGPQLGDVAPFFTAESTIGTVNFPDDYIYKWKILFSHPADFTPVCTSEILELAAAQGKFDKLKTKLIVVSVDNLDTHRQWEKSMEAIKYKDRGPINIDFPLVSDENKMIAREYGMIQKNASTTRDVRGVFIVDPKNRIRAIFYYPMEIGRNLPEIERTLVALQTADAQHVVIPADWQPGDDVLVPYSKSVAKDDKIFPKDDPDYYQLTWYMRFKKETK